MARRKSAEAAMGAVPTPPTRKVLGYVRLEADCTTSFSKDASGLAYEVLECGHTSRKHVSAFSQFLQPAATRRCDACVAGSLPVVDVDEIRRLPRTPR